MVLCRMYTWRGNVYRAEAGSRIERNQRWLYDHIKGILPLFQAVSFDNLALQQLDFRRYLSDDEWAEFYSGDEGQFSFYLDLVGGTYAVNSLSRPIGRIGNMEADQMFQSVREYTAKGGPA